MTIWFALSARAGNSCVNRLILIISELLCCTFLRIKGAQHGPVTPSQSSISFVLILVILKMTTSLSSSNDMKRSYQAVVVQHKNDTL